MPASAQDLADYARARAADAAGEADVAAAGYGRALASAPDDQLLAMRTYRQALAAGDLDLAARGAAVLVRAKVAPADSDVLAFAIALHGGDWLGAENAVERLSNGPLAFLAPVLGAWLAQDRGENPLPLLDTARGDPIGARFAARHRPLLLIASRRESDAMIALAAQPPGEAATDARLDLAIALLRAGRAERAAELLGGGYADWRRRIAKEGRPDAAFGAAHLFVGLAGDLADQRLDTLSILLSRAALLLDPSEDRARLLLADALSREGSPDLALATLAEIRSDTPFARAAAASRVAALRSADRDDDALAAAKALAGRADASSDELRAYGDALTDAGRYGDAAGAYGEALTHAGAGDGWRLHYLQGAALDRAGRWAEALPALRKAVELGPDEPSALTYLGYAQVARGEHLADAQALLERAHKLKPDDAGITDSLGWAWYRRGNAAKALPLLERASRADPAGSRVNEHLGDAYWTLGRHYEARYAWRAATATAEADALDRLRQKLAKGLE